MRRIGAEGFGCDLIRAYLLQFSGLDDALLLWRTGPLVRLVLAFALLLMQFLGEGGPHSVGAGQESEKRRGCGADDTGESHWSVVMPSAR